MKKENMMSRWQGKMETLAIVALFLAVIVIFVIAGYIWIKSQDETRSLEGEIVYSGQKYPIIINHQTTNLSLIPNEGVPNEGDRVVSEGHILG